MHINSISASKRVFALLLVCFIGNALSLQSETQLRLVPSSPLENISQQLKHDSFGDISITQTGYLKLSNLRFEGDVEVVYYPDGVIPGEGSLEHNSENEYNNGERLDYSLRWSVSTKTWDLVTQLPPQKSVTDVILWCSSCSLGHTIVSNTTLATAKITKISGSKKHESGPTVAVVLKNAELDSYTSSSTLLQSTQRALLATCDDSLVVNGVAAPSFDTCIDLSKDAMAPFFLYASLEAPPPGQKGTVFRGAIRAKSSGWAGIAFPQEAGGMINSSSIMVWPDAASPTGALVDGYELLSYEIPEINAARGSYKLLESAAEVDAEGYLVSTFSVVLPAWVKAPSPTPVSILFALGAMTRDGLLGEHSASDSIYGFGFLELTKFSKPPSVKLPPSKASPPRRSLAPARAPAVAPEKVKPAEEDAVEIAEKLCSLEISLANGKRTFASCLPIENVGVDFSMAWDVEEDQNDPESSILTIAMVSSGDKYASVGFPSVPGSMLDAPAVIMQPCSKSSGGGECKNGAEIYEVYMAGYELDDVYRDSRLKATNMTAFRDASTGVMVGSFQVKMQDNPIGTRRRRSLLATDQQNTYSLDAFPLIFASGTVSPAGVAGKHFGDYGSATIDFTNTGTTSAAVSSGGANDGAKIAHMWLMAIGWGVFVPLGILLARMLKPKDSSATLQTQHLGSAEEDCTNNTTTTAAVADWNGRGASSDSPTKQQKGKDLVVPAVSTPPAYWFQLHRALQALGFTMGCVGLALGFVASGGWETPRNEVEVHRDIGMAVTVLGAAQVVAIVWRPKPGTRLRQPWALSHRWLGRSVAILAIANIYYGMLKVEIVGTWALATYSAVLGAIILAGVASEIVNYMHVRHESELPKVASQPKSLSSSTNQDDCITEA